MNRKQIPAAPLFNKVFCVHAKNDDLKEADWRECFSQYGDILSVHIARNKQTKQPTGYTYIEFEKTSEACIAMEEMDNNTVKPNTRTIRVHLAHKKEDNLEIDVELDKLLERLCVKHSRHDGEEELKQHFSQFGTIVRINVLKDKQTREPIGITFIKYNKQSETALALEECDQKYKPRWADVRAQDPAKVAMNQAAEGYDDGYGMGYGGMGLDDPLGFPMPSRALAMAEARAARLGRIPPLDDRLGRLGAARDPFAIAGNGSLEMDSGPKVLEAMVPPSMTRQQVFKLFDIAQGMISCDLQADTGLARIEYSSGKHAAHAKEKIDGLDIFGQTVAIRFAKNQMANKMANLEEKAMKLEEQLRQMRTKGGVDPERMNFLVQSLSEVTQELKQGTMGRGGGAGGGVGDGQMGEGKGMVQWCNVPIPPPQPMLPRNSMQKGKCFIVTTPESVSNEMLRNLFCRFGDLIMCGYQPGKRFGFANYGSLESAQNAIDTLNGASLWFQGQEMSLKVEMSNQGKENQGGDDPVPRKRSRPF